MTVDDAMPRDGKRVCRDHPGEPDAERKVRVVPAQKRGNSFSRAGYDDIEVERRGANDLVQVQIAFAVVANGEECCELVSLGAKQLRQPFDGWRHLGDQDDSQPRSKWRIRSQSVTTLSKSACSVCA